MNSIFLFAIGLHGLISETAEALAKAPELVDGSTDIALTIYASIASIIAALLGWLGKRVADWLKAKTKNEMVGGAIARFTDSVFGAVKAVNQTLKKEIEAAKDPKSPGGAAITKDEAAKLKDAVWDSLKAEYGGMAGISKALSVLGIGGDSAISKWVDNKIEAAVHDTKGAAPLP